MGWGLGGRQGSFQKSLTACTTATVVVVVVINVKLLTCTITPDAGSCYDVRHVWLSNFARGRTPAAVCFIWIILIVHRQDSSCVAPVTPCLPNFTEALLLSRSCCYCFWCRFERICLKNNIFA